MAKTYAAGTTVYKSRPGPRTQARMVYDAVKNSAGGAITKAAIVAALAAEGHPVSDKNVAFYLNRLRRAGYIVDMSAGPVVAPTMGADAAAYAALAALENALVAKAKESGITDAMERDYARYLSVKKLALDEAKATVPGGSVRDGDIRLALRTAILLLVKLVY